jgi:predicted nucleic acid-binding protein
VNTHLHPTVFFPVGLGMISQVSFFVSALISSNITAFHIGSCMAVFQSQGTIAEYREVVKALKAGDNLSRETKSEIRCDVEGVVLPFRVHNLISFL